MGDSEVGTAAINVIDPATELIRWLKSTNCDSKIKIEFLIELLYRNLLPGLLESFFLNSRQYRSRRCAVWSVSNKWSTSGLYKLQKFSH